MPFRSSADLLDRAKQADIREVASRYTTLKRVTAIDGAGPCPVCGGRDRFGVNVRKQVWNCRGCGKGGDVIALVQHVEGLPFHAAVERLTGEQIERERTRLPEAPKRQPEPDDKRIHDFNLRIAARIVSEIVPLIGTPGETYLRATSARSTRPRSPTFSARHTRSGGIRRSYSARTGMISTASASARSSES